MHITKKLLLMAHGDRCMMCGKYDKLKNLEWHHIVPSYVRRLDHLPPDDSLENGAILCKKCHKMLHMYWWWEDEYQLLTEIILENKEKTSPI